MKNDETMFIGLEGFSEIEYLTSREDSRRSSSQRHSGFSKRSSRSAANSAKRRSKSGGVQKTRYELYRERREASVVEPVLHKNRNKYARLDPAYRKHTVVKKRAVLAVAACVTAVTLSCVTVAGAIQINSFEPTKHLTVEDADNIIESTDQLKNSGYIVPVATGDELDPYALKGPDIVGDVYYSGLYIDDELIGVTDKAEELEQALDDYLVEYRSEYDDTTTTSFENDVYIKRGDFDESQVKTVDELMELSESKFSVRLETDWIYTVETEYDSVVTYDDTQPTTYSEVTKEGQNGESEVTLRLIYIDGVQTGAEETGTKVIKKPVSEEITKGSNESITPAKGESTGQFIWPLPHTHNLTSLMEWRWGRMHNGIDIAGGDDYGQPIIAADGGEVIWSGNDGGGYGNYVMIDHGNGYVTVYGHASELNCSTGDYVAQGDVIAYVGSTGNSTGPHLHFEIRLDGEYQDPLNYVS